MSWEDIEQVAGRTQAIKAPCSVALTTRARGQTRLWVTVSAALREELGWAIGQALHLQVGRGSDIGTIRVVPREHRRTLRILPKSGYCSVELVPPEDLARWQGPRSAAHYDVLVGGRRKGSADPVGLAVTLPWQLPVGDDGLFAAASDAAGADDGAEAAAA